MPSYVKFNLEDKRVEVFGQIDNAVEQFLTEASGEIVSMTARNSRVDTGQLKSSWSAIVEGNVATIGSPLENAIWEEFGTGIHAENGDGRKTSWVYTDKDGEKHWTRGKTKNLKGFRFTYNSLLPKLKKVAQDIFKMRLK